MKFNNIARKAGICLVIAVSLVAAQQKHHFSPREKAFYADAATVEFVNPGMAITVTGATIVAKGTITVQYTLTDPTRLPLDSAGINTPGTISTRGVYSQRAGAVHGLHHQGGHRHCGRFDQSAGRRFRRNRDRSGKRRVSICIQDPGPRGIRYDGY